MAHNPLAQFEIKKIVDLSLFGYDVSLTNSACFMLVSALVLLFYFSLALKSRLLIPSRLQVSAEMIYGLITDMLDQNVGPKGRKFIPFIFSLFLFILICNLLGMLPYSFTVTSHISITFALAIVVFFIVTLVGFIKNGFG